MQLGKVLRIRHKGKQGIAEQTADDNKYGINSTLYQNKHQQDFFMLPVGFGNLGEKRNCVFHRDDSFVNDFWEYPITVLMKVWYNRITEQKF